MPRTPSSKATAKEKGQKQAKSKAKTQRVLVADLTTEQDELLQSVQYKSGLLAGRDPLYLATRQYMEETGSDVKQPTKRQVMAWLKGEPSHERQQTTGAAFAENKPVAVIRRSKPLSYVQFDAFQLDERIIPNTKVKYTNKKSKLVTVPLVQKYAVIMVDAFSKMVWVRLLATPKGAGIASTWVGLKSNPKVIGTLKALDSMFKEIAADLRDESPPRRFQELKEGRK